MDDGPNSKDIVRFDFPFFSSAIFEGPHPGLHELAEPFKPKAAVPELGSGRSTGTPLGPHWDATGTPGQLCVTPGWKKQQ